MNIEIQYWGWVLGIGYVFWMLASHGTDRRDFLVSRAFSLLIMLGIIAEAITKWVGIDPSLSVILWMVILGVLLIGGVPGLRYRTNSAAFRGLTFHGIVAILFAFVWQIGYKLIA